MSVRRSVAPALAEVGGAVFLCSWTTIVGYGSLVMSFNRALRSFGWYAALGELTTLITAVVLLPAIAKLVPAHACMAKPGEVVAAEGGDVSTMECEETPRRPDACGTTRQRLRLRTRSTWLSIAAAASFAVGVVTFGAAFQTTKDLAIRAASGAPLAVALGAAIGRERFGRSFAPSRETTARPIRTAARRRGDTQPPPHSS